CQYMRRCSVGIDSVGAGVGIDGHVGPECFDKVPVETIHDAQLVYRKERTARGMPRRMAVLIGLVLVTASDRHRVLVDVVEEISGQLGGVIVALGSGWQLRDDVVENIREEQLRILSRMSFVEEGIQI